MQNKDLSSSQPKAYDLHAPFVSPTTLLYTYSDDLKGHDDDHEAQFKKIHFAEGTRDNKLLPTSLHKA